VLRTRYRSDAFQHGYFVIPSFAALLRLLTDADLASLYEELEAAGDLNIDRAD
jgi:phenylalanine-4-hydroxylase